MKLRISLIGMFVLLIVSFLLGKSLSNVLAQATNGQVSICHASASPTNPYQLNHPNIQNDGSLTGGHLNHTGGIFPTPGWGDIIPPYDWLSCPSGYKLDNDVCTKNNEADVTPTPKHYDGLNWTAEGEEIWDNECEIPNDDGDDVCSNFQGTQTSVPDGYYQSNGACYLKTPVCGDNSYSNYGGEDGIFDQEIEIADNKLCTDDTTEPTPFDPDLCHNIDGIQTSVPEGLHLSGANNDQCVSFSVPGVEEPSGGAPQGQVLGASTMAATGTFTENLYIAIMGIGAAIASFGLRKAFQVAK